ncbi:hypothetical protein EYF80_021751 [Liparis tanakae]|uniref:Uncharacterized protein n=1 Tax=Liparis tanakae TaxID=230148 RepID=A0A4Z2HQ48_9TELE|nr:hypothetical protein EYF80_021751 [Liparis tanakae]
MAAWLALGSSMGLGLKAGGLSCTPMRGATRGLNVLMVSLEELVLRRMGGSVLAVDLSVTPWMGLRDSLELAGVGPPPPPPDVCRCSRLVYWPEEVERRIGGLSIFFSDSLRLMLDRLPWPVRRRRSGLSVAAWPRLRSTSRGLKWPRTGEPTSGGPACPPWPCWEGCAMQWTSLGRAGGRRDGGSDLFLCLLGYK